LLEVDGYGVAVDRVLVLLLLRQLALLRFRPLLGGIGRDDGSIGTPAVDCGPLRGCHRRCVGAPRPRNSLRRFKLLHGGGYFLLVLALLGIPSCLQLLLGLEAIDLLRIRCRRPSRGKAGRRHRPPVPAQQAGKVGDANQGHDDNQSDDDRHGPAYWCLCDRLLRNSRRRGFVGLGHG